jgi:hypothetical protein
METKCLILQRSNKNTKKPIVFDSVLNVNFEIEKVSELKPTVFKYIELICKNYAKGVDLMYAYDDEESANNGAGTLVLGQWNDGVVE